MQTKSIPYAIAILCLVANAAFAQTKAAEPEPDYTAAFNVGVVSDYRYRGITQTRYRPALQAGFDFTHKSGFYAGTALSNIKWISDYSTTANNVKGDVELDLYGGYKGSITKDLAYDVGLIQYAYLGNTLSNTGGGNVYANANTTEIYGALTYSVFTVKYSHAVSRLLGIFGSRGAGYLEAAANFDLGNGWSVAPHLGFQKVGKTANTIYGNDQLSYTDYSMGVSKDFSNGLVLTGSVVGTNASDKFWTSSAGNNKFLGKTGVVLGAKYTF